MGKWLWIPDLKQKKMYKMKLYNSFSYQKARKISNTRKSLWKGFTEQVSQGFIVQRWQNVLHYELLTSSLNPGVHKDTKVATTKQAKHVSLLRKQFIILKTGKKKKIILPLLYLLYEL